MVESYWVNFRSAPADTVDHEATRALARDLMRAVVAHYRSRNMARSSTLEVLNALASTSAIVLAGTEDDREARAFFALALEQNIADLLANPPAPFPQR